MKVDRCVGSIGGEGLCDVTAGPAHLPARAGTTAPMPVLRVPVRPGRCDPVIGGLFGLDRGLRPRTRPAPFLTGRDLFLANGRCGIWLLVHRLRPARVWVPSYLCRQGILEAIDRSISGLRFYEVDYDLSVRSREWVSEVLPGDLVILIDYFGFPCDHGLASLVKEKGAWVLEDACQALLSAHVGSCSDFVLFNIVKWIGIPDGAVLRFPEAVSLRDTPLEAPPLEWRLKALQACVLRREFDDGIATREWFRLFRELEDGMPAGPYAMSELARTVMTWSVDYAGIAERRRDNYRVLLDRLEAYALFPRLEPGVVPLGFPVRVAERDRVRQALFDEQIYPPVHWQLSGVVPPRFADSLRLARDIMTLPCDQRYGSGDMERTAEIFLRAARRSVRA